MSKERPSQRSGEREPKLSHTDREQSRWSPERVSLQRRDKGVLMIRKPPHSKERTQKTRREESYTQMWYQRLLLFNISKTSLNLSLSFLITMFHFSTDISRQPENVKKLQDVSDVLIIENI